MIISEREHEFVMITQHDHAKLSGEVARKWKSKYFLHSDKKDDVIYGIFEHDRAWIDLDDTPFWNDRNQTPYSFMDFPLKPKLSFYRMGINQLEGDHPYAALLCSLHYASFFKDAEDDIGRWYLEEEKRRQWHLMQKLGVKSREDEQGLAFHLHLLQFCDNLSLYICLNEPGIAKENELSWYKNGFPQRFPFFNENKIMANWIDNRRVSLQPFPLEQPISLSLPIKVVRKNFIHKEGVAQAYAKAPWLTREATLIPLNNVRGAG